jgi:hypothetical protein
VADPLTTAGVALNIDGGAPLRTGRPSVVLLERFSIIALPPGKPVSTFPENTLERRR